MEWYDDRAFQAEAKADTRRVLTSTSGNAQSFILGSNQSAEKHNSSEILRLSSDHQYPTPITTLYSNDRRALLRQKLNARRLKKRLRLAHAYLQHPKFLEFRNRPRKDLDKTGEIIWDDELEAAFQNAIINIPGIGRKKKSQHGKPLGRNELVSEWIRQETGKTRSRKQVSSHIQTLDKIFQAKPDEDFPGLMITRPPAAGEDGDDLDGIDFYENSIADMVRNWRAIQNDISQIGFDSQSIPPSHFTEVKVDTAESHSLSTLGLCMWVCLPEKMEIDNSLHRYTFVQSTKAAAVPEPLENTQDWRTSWPELVPLIDRSFQRESLNVILLHASFELMLDFPPPRSKLGINLELDFDIPGLVVCDQKHCMAWTCTTHINLRGRLEATTKHTGCLSSASGRVKIPFESKWWATQFARLTEKRRLAMDAGSDAAVAVADEAARNYLSSLKIMQQVFMGVDLSDRSRCACGSDSSRERRMVILLWSFSQAGPNSSGTTTWRKVIPPSGKATGDAPVLPSQITALPSLAPDVIIEAAFDDNPFQSHNGFIPHSLQSTVDRYPAGAGEELDEEFRQNGFSMPAQYNDLTTMAMPYEDLSGFEFPDHSYHNEQSFNYNTQHLDRSIPQHDMPFPEQPQNEFSSNLFDAQEHLRHAYTQQPVLTEHQHNERLDIPPELDYYQRRQALLSFDVNTHKMLQAQLQGPKCQSHSALAPPPPYQQLPTDQSATVDPDDEALQSALIRGNVQHLNHPLNPDPGHAPNLIESRHQHASQEDPYPFVTASTAVRPPLQHHHSFSGVLQPIATLGNVRDDSSRSNLIAPLNSLSSDHIEYGDSNNLVGVLDQYHSLGFGTMRSHSQPPPLITTVSTNEPVDKEIEVEVEREPGVVDQDQDQLGEAGGEWVEVKIEEIQAVNE